MSVGSRAAFGYDVETGREIWTVRHDDFNAAARPLFEHAADLIAPSAREQILNLVDLQLPSRADLIAREQLGIGESGLNDVSIDDGFLVVH